MAYIGNSPANVGNYQEIDDFSSSFNGALTTFALTVNGDVINPAKSGQLLINVSGVLQEPDDSGVNGFKVSGSNIIFSEAPSTDSSFWGMFQGQNVDVGTPSNKTVGVEQISDEGLSNIVNIPSRNCLITSDPLSQDGSAEQGFGSTIYTGNATIRSITTGMDMFTGDFGGLLWIKGRSAASTHTLFDSTRTTDLLLRTDQTSVEYSLADGFTGFNDTGFDLGTSNWVNANTDTFVAWSFQTNKKTTGLTNHNKAYTCHYNPNTNFSIVGYEGDGVDGHEIPHHLGVAPELSIYKSRDSVDNWVIKSSVMGIDSHLYFTTAALGVSVGFVTDDNTTKITSWNDLNGAGLNNISYHFASKSGICKIGKYIGTGAAGNYVSTEVDGGDAFKPQFVMVKNLTNATNWVIADSIRPDGYLYPNLTNIESGAEDIFFDENGFYLGGADADTNQLNDEFIFMAFAESSIDATKALTDYTLPTNADQLAITNPTTISFASGFNAYGQVDSTENLVSGTITLGAGFESKKLYIYRDKGTAWGTSEVRPLTGLTRSDADKSGVVSPSDSTLRTTAKHFDYESETGVVLASDENYPAYNALDKDSNDIDSSYSYWYMVGATSGWWQYKHNEPRILKSWRLRAQLATRLPKLFTIQGSNDGYNWTAIDSTYTASNYTGTDDLWGALQSTTGNTTAYLYHRILITANNGNGDTGFMEFELNTKIASDYFLEPDGKIYNDADTELERVYVGECITDSDGDISSYINYTSGKKVINELEALGDVTIHGDLIHPTARIAMISFDGTKNPPLEVVNEGGLFIVDGGTGSYLVYVPDDIDLDKATWSATVGATTYNASVQRTGLKNLRIFVRNDASTYSDDTTVQLQIFGGKS